MLCAYEWSQTAAEILQMKVFANWLHNLYLAACKMIQCSLCLVPQNTHTRAAREQLRCVSQKGVEEYTHLNLFAMTFPSQICLLSIYFM